MLYNLFKIESVVFLGLKKKNPHGTPVSVVEPHFQQRMSTNIYAPLPFPSSALVTPAGCSSSTLRCIPRGKIFQQQPKKSLTFWLSMSLICKKEHLSFKPDGNGSLLPQCAEGFLKTFLNKTYTVCQQSYFLSVKHPCIWESFTDIWVVAHRVSGLRKMKTNLKQ